MNKFSVKSKYISASPRSQRRKGAVATATPSAGVAANGGIDRSYIDANFVNLFGEQVIEGLKDFVNGLKLGGMLIRYDAETNTLFLPCNLLVEKGMAFNSSIDGFTPQTITDAVKIDGATIRQNASGELYAVSGGTGGEGGGFDESQLADYLASNGYITSAALTPYATTNYVTIALNGYAPLATTLAGYGIADAYTRDEVDSAITAAFNTFATDISNDGIVNTYKELIDYAATHGAELTTLVGQVANKADKATTLAGYGIADAYTKTEADSAFAKKATTLAGYGIADAYTKTEIINSFVDKTSAQSISGIKDFANGLKIGGVSVVYNAEKNALILPCNLLVEKGMAFNSSIDGFTPQTITDAVKIDGVTIRQNASGELYAIGGGTGGVSADFVASYVSSALTGYLPLSGGDISGIVKIQSLRVKDSNFSIGSANSTEGFIIYEGGTGWYVSDENWGNAFAIIHAGNISQYAIPTSGGVINGDLSVSGVIQGTTLRAASDFLVVPSQVRFLSSGSYSNNAFFLNYDAASEDVVNILMGKTVSRYNCGYIGYYHSSNESTSNAITIGGYYADHLMMVFFDGTVAIGGMVANEKLHVYGNIRTEGQLLQTSARSLKNIAGQNYLTIEELEQIIPYRYTWLDGRDSIEHIGGIADEVKEIMPEAVIGDSPDTLAMDYGVAAFVMASSLTPYVSDHDRRIELLERENVALKEEIKKLKAA